MLCMNGMYALYKTYKCVMYIHIYIYMIAAASHTRMGCKVETTSPEPAQTKEHVISLVMHRK